MSDDKSENVTWHHGEIDRATREAVLGHRAACLWFTGLSGAGKSTLARRVERRLVEERCGAYVLDGDNLRHGLNGDLGFSPDDRAENIRRVGEVARLFVDAGTLVLCAFVSPYRADRDAVRAKFPEGDFLEIHVAADLATCEARDPKGLYAKARAGAIQGFTGIDAPYEAPLAPELAVDTGARSLDEAAAEVIALLRARGIVPTSG